MASINVFKIAKILKIILASVSQDLKDSLTGFLDQLEEKAKATRNPFDDLLVELLRMLVG